MCGFCDIVDTMRLVVFFVAIFLSSAVYAGPDGAIVRAAKSLLTVQNYPKTFDDLSFVNRMAVLADGYIPWEGEYDNNGRCIKGCAFKGMTIEDELKRAEQNTQQAVTQLQESGHLPVVEPTNQVTQSSGQVTAWRPTVTYNPDASEQQQQEEIVQVAPVSGPAVQAGQSVPVGWPIANKVRITSPFGERIHPITKKRQVHRGVDLATPTGTSVLSPANGYVLKLRSDSICGNGLEIRHSDGFDTVYCHLSQFLVSEGETVADGDVVAKTGNTGRSTGPHLHYAVKYNGEYINPEPLMSR